MHDSPATDGCLFVRFLRSRLLSGDFLCFQDLTLSSMRLAMETASSAGTADVTVLAIEGTNDLDYPLPKTRGSTNR